MNHVKIDFDLFNKKLKTYNKVFNRDEFEIKLEEKRKIYVEEIQRLTKVFDDFENCKQNILMNIDSVS
jgi:hypothetical protein